jgi:hypothetical protein
MFRMFRSVGAFSLCALISLGLVSTSTASTDPPAALRLNALSMNLTGFGWAGLQRVRIVVDRWSTDEEQTRLINTMVNKPDSLLSQMQDIAPRAGFVQTDGSLGWDLLYAHEETLPDGSRRILLATDRPMSFREAVSQPILSTYGFTVFQIQIGADGRGQGELLPAAKIAYNTATKKVEIENYAFTPLRLTAVAEEK